MHEKTRDAVIVEIPADLLGAAMSRFGAGGFVATIGTRSTRMAPRRIVNMMGQAVICSKDVTTALFVIKIDLRPRDAKVETLPHAAAIAARRRCASPFWRSSRTASRLAEAAKAAGLTPDAIRKAMKGNSAARDFYTSELKALLYFAKAKPAHALIKELDGPNAAARVAAARTLLEENERGPAGNNMPQVPGLAAWLRDLDR